MVKSHAFLHDHLDQASFNDTCMKLHQTLENKIKSWYQVKSIQAVQTKLK